MRIARKLVGAAGAIVALGLVIHVPPVMHWLAAHGHHGAGVCPLGYGRAPARVAHDPAAAPEPVLAFELGRTTAGDVGRWALGHGVACRALHGGGELECANLPGTALDPTTNDAPAGTAWFDLDAANVVRSIQVTRRGDVVPVSRELARIAQLERTAHGAPVRTSGSPAPADLARGALRQAMVEYRTAHYRAIVRATNMGDGYVLAERYELD